MSDDNEPNEWINALLELIDKFDCTRLARLLRSDTPMPLAARDVLADLLDPPKPINLVHRRLVMRHDRKGSIANDRKMLADAQPYRDLRTYGMPAQDAAAEAGEKRNLSERTIFRRLAQRDELRAELARIIFGDDLGLTKADTARQRKSRGKAAKSRKEGK